MDIPNARSSHRVPTPRGGGVAIVVSFLLALPVFALTGVLDRSAAAALLGAGAWVAAVGFLDDHGHVAARWRLLAHFAAAAWTLLRRLLRGERVYEAHRSHAYQYASRELGRHLPVTLAVGAINLAWLLPIALWVGLDGLLGVAIAYAPLVGLALRFRAGEPEVREAS
jgi:Fuc2NAc and GlcNAc transferase